MPNKLSPYTVKLSSNVYVTFAKNLQVTGINNEEYIGKKISFLFSF